MTLARDPTKRRNLGANGGCTAGRARGDVGEFAPRAFQHRDKGGARRRPN